jgi:hypothetical protein
MSDAVSPILAASDRRAGRRSTDPSLRSDKDEASCTGANLPVPVGKSAQNDPLAASFEAQRLGQEGQKRGLRGGPPVLKHAKSAYLGAEWSGKADRRPPKGLFSKTEV